MSRGLRFAIVALVAVASVWIGRRLAAPSQRHTAASPHGQELANGREDRTPTARTGGGPRRAAAHRPLRRLGAWSAHVQRDPARHGQERRAVLGALMTTDTSWTAAYARCASIPPSPAQASVRVRLDLRLTRDEIVVLSGEVLGTESGPPVSPELQRCLTEALPRGLHIRRPAPADVEPYEGPFELLLPAVLPQPPESAGDDRGPSSRGNDQ